MKRLASALLTGTLSLSCVVFSQHPIRGEQPSVLDPELAGSWRSLEDGKPDTDEEPATFVSHGDHYIVSDEPTDTYELTTARLGGHRYLNAVEVGDESSSGIAIWRYEIRDDRLVMAPMDYDAAKRLVKTGVLRGVDLDEVKAADAPPRSSMGAKGLLLTGSTKEIEAYLLEHGPLVLFPDAELSFVREPVPGKR